MRHRIVRNLDEKLAKYTHYVVEDAKEMKGKWRSLFENEGELYMELGCGKGRFISTHADLNRDRNYIAIEGQKNVVLRAFEKVEEKELTNVKFVMNFIEDITDYFEDGELDGIYLNFSDPWPKARHAKRRLTHTRFLKGYEKVIKKGGFVEFKTDNDGLFEFSLEEIEANEYKIVEMTRDLHASEYESKDIMTEYEEKFSSRGKNINYVKFTF